MVISNQRLIMQRYKTGKFNRYKVFFLIKYIHKDPVSKESNQPDEQISNDKKR